MPVTPNHPYRLTLLALLLLPAVAYLAIWRGGARKDLAGFRDVAPEAGLDFLMAFLPNEQGERFKINLYDHGCGLVVGDYDGDGLDDLLLLNQLGANGLFQNLGDGQFADRTDQNPAVALTDRVCVGGTFADFDNDGDQDLYITSGTDL